MTFGESIRICFAKYADCTGIASRSEFWWWALFNLVASIALDVVDHRLWFAFAILTVLPYLAVTARRRHDTGRSGWWQLIWLVPLVGWIIVIYWLAQAGKAVGLLPRAEPLM